jgi:hypothetical protein
MITVMELATSCARNHKKNKRTAKMAKVETGMAFVSEY